VMHHRGGLAAGGLVHMQMKFVIFI
jgi:hypothetical protein